MSEIKARARRRAFCLGSCTMNGLTGRRGPVERFAGGTGAAGAAGGGAALGTVIVGVGAGDAGRAGANGGRAIGAAGAAGAAGRLGGAAGGDITGRWGAAIGGAAGGAARGGGGGAGGAGGARGAGGAGGAGGAAAAAAPAPAPAPAPSELTAKTLLQTLQRARKPPAGTLAGSTRYTVSHDGQVTFTPRPRCLRFLLPRARDRGAGRRQRPIPPASSRSSSFPSPAH